MTGVLALTRPGTPPAQDSAGDDAAWVTDQMLGLPCGARRLPPGYAGAVGYAPAAAGESWLVVAVIGQHLPLPYPDSEIGVLTAGICPDLGLCPGCLGMGDLAGFPPLPGADAPGLAAFLARGFGCLTSPCPRCGGSGRPALRILTRIRGGQVARQVMPLIHRYVPPLPGTCPPPPPGQCLACGQAGPRLNCRVS